MMRHLTGRHTLLHRLRLAGLALLVFLLVVLVGMIIGGSEWRMLLYLGPVGIASIGLLLVVQAMIAHDRAEAHRHITVLTMFNGIIDRLGAPTSSVRLGAIYALYHLAIREEQYRGTIHDILCAHLRETTQQEA